MTRERAMDSVKTDGREPTADVLVAAVAHRQINGECGGATVFCIVLADGEIIDLGQFEVIMSIIRYLCFTRERPESREQSQNIRRNCKAGSRP